MKSKTRTTGQGLDPCRSGWAQIAIGFFIRLLLVVAMIFAWSLAPASAQQTKKQKLNAALAQAVEDNKVTKVQQLLAQGADPNTKDEWGVTVLLTATNSGYLTLSQMLLDKGASVHRAAENGNNPIATAVAHGNMTMVQMLMKRGATLEEAETGMANCALSGHMAMLKFLLDKGVKVDTMGDQRFNLGGWTPLGAAAIGGQLETVQLLLDRKADVNAATESHQTILMLAVSAENVAPGKIAQVVKLLLSRGAKVDGKTDSDPPKTALSLAKEKKLTDTVKLLQDAGAKE